jgi:hypothetical protein
LCCKWGVGGRFGEKRERRWEICLV